MENVNPLLCDYETGVCEIPGSVTAKELETTFENKQKPVQIIYFTDPICSSCWGIEPEIRKLKLEYGPYINVEYHMGGLLPSWRNFNSGGIVKPSDVADHWDEVSRHYQMPIDGNVWLEDPLDSSYPPSIAFIAAKMQDEIKAGKFLRRIKEMVFIEKKNIAKWENLSQAASETALDIVKLKHDFEGDARELFETDLNFARAWGVRGFPTLFFINETGSQEKLYGVKPYVYFEQIIRNLHPGVEKVIYSNDPAAIFSHYPTLTTKEFAVITNRTMEDSENILHELFGRNQVEKIPCRNGAFWKIPGAV